MDAVLACAVFRTALGWVGLSASSVGLIRLVLPRCSEEEARDALDTPDASDAPSRFGDLIERLQSYFGMEKVNFPDVVDIDGVEDFSRRVWGVVRTIPYGEVRSYGWVAARIGVPGAARVVGWALAANPLPVIIPCHRVLMRDGGLGGFRWGVDMKERLLGLEGVSACAWTWGGRRGVSPR